MVTTNTGLLSTIVVTGLLMTRPCSSDCTPDVFSRVVPFAMTGSKTALKDSDSVLLPSGTEPIVQTSRPLLVSLAVLSIGNVALPST